MKNKAKDGDSKWGGKREGSGRIPKISTVAKRFQEKYPRAYDELMEVLYLRGLKEKHAESAQYVINRLKGSPKQQIDQRISGTVHLTALQNQAAIEEARDYERRQLTTTDIDESLPDKDTALNNDDE